MNQKANNIKLFPMKKWMVFLLGIITGFVLTLVLAFIYTRSSHPGISGLTLFETPGDYMDYSEFEVFQVIENGCALARGDREFDALVLIIPNDGDHFYDDQKITLKENQCAQRIGTFQYETKSGFEKTIPAVIIADGVDIPRPNKKRSNSDITLFDKPGDCVSRKNFEVQRVLDSGDAIAREIREVMGGYVFTSDLEVLILAQNGSNYYDNQIIKCPNGKCARQIGTYKHLGKVLPIVDFQ